MQNWSVDMLRWQVSCVVSFALLLMAGPVVADGNLTFGGGVPAVTDTPPTSLVNAKKQKRHRQPIPYLADSCFLQTVLKVV
jgi:hypothetical protein